MTIRVRDTRKLSQETSDSESQVIGFKNVKEIWKEKVEHEELIKRIIKEITDRGGEETVELFLEEIRRTNTKKK